MKFANFVAIKYISTNLNHRQQLWHIISHLRNRLQKSNAWRRERLLKIISNWTIHKFLFRSLPVWETGDMVCRWLSSYWWQGMFNLE